MPDLQGGRMTPLSIPLLLILFTRPDMEERLSQLASFLEATRNALETMRSGMETLQASLKQLAQEAGINQNTTILPAGIPEEPEPASPEEVPSTDGKSPKMQDPGNI